MRSPIKPSATQANELEKPPTYPFPNATLSVTFHLGQKVGLGGGGEVSLGGQRHHQVRAVSNHVLLGQQWKY